MELELNDNGVANTDTALERTVFEEKHCESRSDSSGNGVQTPPSETSSSSLELDETKQVTEEKILAVFEENTMVDTSTERSTGGSSSSIKGQSVAGDADEGISSRTGEFIDQVNGSPTILNGETVIEGDAVRDEDVIVDEVIVIDEDEGNTNEKDGMADGEKEDDEEMEIDEKMVFDEEKSDAIEPEIIITCDNRRGSDDEESEGSFCEDADSPSRIEWLRQKDVEGAENNCIDSLMAMVGLEEVKAHFLRMKARIETARRQSVDMSKERFGVALVGNPGTGKTTVARLYARFLMSIGIAPNGEFVETNPRTVRNLRGVGGTAGDLKMMERDGGGVFFVDEAHQLIDDSSSFEHLLGAVEKYQGKIVFMFAGNSHKMDGFLGYDPGVPSRIPHTIKFSDYSDDDLLRILVRLIKVKFRDRMQVEGGIGGLYSRILVRRLGRGRGKKGFGNARALENAFSKVCERQADRLSKDRRDKKEPNYFLLTKEDMVGPEPGDALSKSTAWSELQGLIGLEEVKESIKAFIHLVHVNYQRELEEKEPIQVGLNRVFLGPAGTGKTTVGKLYGQTLADLGLLSSGKVVIKNPSDFIGEHLGWSEKATRRILNGAKGKVLIIDEAYMLYPGSRSGSPNQSDVFRLGVIDTLIAETQNIPGDDRCVILIGYTEPMTEMFHAANPGLARRFPIEDAFHFTDYSIDQLAQILDQKVQKQQISMTPAAKQVALQVLSLARDRPNFGNGGEVENILSRAKASHQKRLSTSPTEHTILEPSDFDPNFERLITRGKSCKDLFQDLVGCDDIIAQLSSYQQLAEGMRLHGIDPRPHIPFTFVFKGPPGTGKTTTARKFGQVFYEMGFLSSATVVECSVSDLVGEFQGHTGPKVINLLGRALGKVLFIDEAYRLGQGRWARDAVDELVDCVTKRRFENKIVIVLAGYEEDMNGLMRVNRGLASRFATHVVFRNMSPRECLMLLQQRLGRLGIRILGLEGRVGDGGEMVVVVEKLFAELVATEGWGNGRDVETLAKRVMGYVFRSCAEKGTKEGDLTVSFKELVPIVRSMLFEKQAWGNRGSGFCNKS